MQLRSTYHSVSVQIIYQLSCYDLSGAIKPNYEFLSKDCRSLHQAKILGTKFCKQYRQIHNRSTMYLITSCLNYDGHLTDFRTEYQRNFDVESIKLV